LLMQWTCQLPVSYLLAHYTSLGVAGIWWGFPIANTLALVATLLWFRRGTWKYKTLTQSQVLTARAAIEAHVEEGAA
jgi:Na+-driven multidrug efflux pump